MHLALPDGAVDTDTGELTRGGASGRLTSRERALLDYLARRLGEVVPTEELLREVWGYGPHVVSRAVFHTMRRLRARIEVDPTQPRMLLAEHGVGYRLVLPHAPATGEPAAAARGPSPLAPLSVPAQPVAPLPAAPLHGREEELRRIAAALRRPARLLHLVGPPGVGKTRLAREACPAPTWRFVALEPEPTLGRLEGALVSALGLASPAALPAALAEGGVGVVLDGVARLPPGAERWLDPGAPPRVLVTGREPFDLLGEQVVHVARLGPEAGARVFEDAVRIVLGEEAVPSRAAVEAAVAALDGLPLALEVAAAQLHALPLPLVLDRLTREGAGDGPLDRAIASSWDIATPEVREGLLRLSVWEGAVPLEAAEQVGVPLAEVEAVVRASLAEWTGGGRSVRLYAVVRRFVRRVAAPGALAGAHAARREALAAQGLPSRLARVHEEGGRGATTLVAVLTDLGAAVDADPQVPAALLRALAVGSQLAGGFATVAPLVRRRFREAASAAERRALVGVSGPVEWSVALGLGADELLADLVPPSAPGPDGVPPDQEERVLRLLHRWQCGLALLHAARLTEAETTFRELAVELRRASLPGLEGLARSYQGSALRQLGRRAEALAAFQAGAPLLDAAGDGRGLAELRNSEGAVRLDAGELDLARAAFVEAREAARRCGDRRLVMRVDGNLSIAERQRGDLAAAEQHALALAEAARRIGARDTEGSVRLNLAVTYVDANRLDEAWAELEQARRLFALTGSARAQVMLAINWGLTRLHGGRWDLDDLPQLYPAGLTAGWRTALVELLVWAGRVARGVDPPPPCPDIPLDTPADALGTCMAWAVVAAAHAGDEAAYAHLRARVESVLTPALSPHLHRCIRRVLDRAPAPRDAATGPRSSPPPAPREH